MVSTDQLSITHGISSLCGMRFDSGPILRGARQRDQQTASSRRNSISYKTSTRRSRSYTAWLRRLLKYWNGSRVDAEGADGKEESGASLFAGCNERATPPDAYFGSRPKGCCRFWCWPALLA